MMRIEGNGAGCGRGAAWRSMFARAVARRSSTKKMNGEHGRGQVKGSGAEVHERRTARSLSLLGPRLKVNTAATR